MAAHQTNSPLQRKIESVIRDFPFDNYGLNDVDIALNDHPDDQEWVPALAGKVLAAINEVTG
ncbi:hypothetical protein [Streptomyces ziwulingensis]|uniref:Uncharacterized protein n=1 Tax=Streptomyces ziwulingensis TaxID=1045501 RepID=A0ABP9D0P5_9ACTN